jgi:predicted amidohydrolase
MVTLVVIFRYQVIAFLVVCRNGIVRVFGGSERNAPADVDRLARLGEPGARWLVRMGEARALAQVEDPSMIPALVELARESGDAKIRTAALMGLSNFHDPRVLEALAGALRDPDPGVRRTAIAGIENLGSEGEAAALRAALNEESDARLRRQIEGAIGRIVPPPEPDATDTVRVAAIQFVSEFGEPEANRARLTPLIREAAAAGAKIVVLPETAITGYMSADIRTTWGVAGRDATPGLRTVSPERAAETVPGPSTKEFCRLAGELGIYLTVPFLEVDPGEAGDPARYFNTLCLAGPGGKLRLHYRKLNPWPFAERSWATPGDRGLAFADTEYGRLGLLVCFDINFEPADLAREGVDTILWSVAWVDREKSPWFGVELPRLARECGVGIIGANWTVRGAVDWHGYGQSLVVSRTGRVLARTSDDAREDIVYADVPCHAPDAAAAESE